MVFRLKDFNNPDENLLETLQKTFNDIIGNVTSNAVEGSKISFSIELPNSPHVKAIWSSLRPVDQLSGEYIIGLISNVNQSNATFLSDDIMQLNADIVNFPSGGAKLDSNCGDENDILIRKRSVIDVAKENDVNCLPRSICYSIEIISREIRQKKQHIQIMNGLDTLAKKLCKDAKVVPSCQGCTLEDLYKFQSFLKNYQTIVFDNMKDASSILFKIPLENIEIKKIFLYYSHTQKHFYVIRSLTGFFNKKYACSFCDKLSNIKIHKCESKCPYCNSFPPCGFVEKVKQCDNCHRTFRGEICFANHFQNQIKNKSICETFRICTLCSKFLILTKRTENDHKCNEYYCQICSKIVPVEHLCYIKPYKEKKNKKFLLIFFDCESTQNTAFGNNEIDFLHVVNLIVAQQICYNCYEKTNIKEKCNICGDRQHIFEYDGKEDVVKNFINYCLKPRPLISKVFCIAHNFQGYDGHFLISELLSRNLTIEPVMNGRKIMKLSCGQVTFIDSLNFLSFPLAKFPEVFNITGHEKGYYPFFF